MDHFRLLGVEADLLDALAVMHGVSAGMALAAGRRIIGQGGGRYVLRQGRALGRLAAATADAFDRDDAELDAPAARRIVALMRRAQALESRAIDHRELIAAPGGWQGRVRINPPSLALLGAMRLRQALEIYVMRSAEPRRLAQLQAVRQLEGDIRDIGRDLDQKRIDGAAALHRVIAAFAMAEPAIGDDVATLLDRERLMAASATILTRGYGAEAVA